jgi:hypothetical protein
MLTITAMIGLSNCRFVALSSKGSNQKFVLHYVVLHSMDDMNFTNKTELHDIAEILLKVVLNTITLTHYIYILHVEQREF